MTALETSLANTPTEFVIEQPRRPIWHEMRSPAFLAVVLRGAVCCLVLAAVVITWELTNAQFSTFFALSAAISLVVLMLRGDLRMRMVPDLTRYVPRVVASVTIGTGFALIIDSASGLWDVSGEVLVRQLAVLTLATMFGVDLGLLLRRPMACGSIAEPSNHRGQH